MKQGVGQKAALLMWSPLWSMVGTGCPLLSQHQLLMPIRGGRAFGGGHLLSQACRGLGAVWGGALGQS